MATLAQIYRVSADISSLESGMARAAVAVEKTATNSERMLNRMSTASLTVANAMGTLLARGAEQAASALAGGLVSGLSRSIGLSQEFNNSMMGLSSTARYMGADVQQASSAAQSLASDGLMKVTDATNGLKNLLSTGFSLPQAIDLMKGFKDSAAFGRQGSLEFGQAVVGATEGIKNGISALSDNAGMTKNLSVIQKEAGLTEAMMTRLRTDAAVSTKYYTQLMAELAGQTGDSERLTNTYSGALSRLNTVYDNFLRQVGDLITNNQTLRDTINWVSDALSGQTSALVQQSRGALLVSDTVIGLVRGFALLIDGLQLLNTGWMAVKMSVLFVASALGQFGIVVGNILRMLDPFNLGLRTLIDTGIDALKDAVASLGVSMKQTGTSYEANSKSLEAMRTAATDLAKDLEKTRGQVLAFNIVGRTTTVWWLSVEAAAAHAGRTLSTTTEELRKAAKAAEDYRDWQTKIFLAEHNYTGEADAMLAPMRWADEMGPGGKLANAIQYVEAGSVAYQKFGEVVAVDVAPSIVQALHTVERNTYVDLTKIGQHIDIGISKWKQLGGSLMTVLQTVPQTVANAFTGGGDLLGAAKSIGSQFGSVIGGTIGTSFAMAGKAAGTVLTGLGALAGPLGAAIGSLVGPLIGALSNAFRDVAWEKTNDLRDNFVDAAGGLATLNQKVMEATGSLALIHQMLDAKTPEAFAKAIEGINVALERQKNIEKAASSRFGPSTEELRATAEEAQAVFDHMRTSGKYTADQIAQAFKAAQWADAMAKGMDVAAMKDQFTALNGEMQRLVDRRKTLFEAVSAEAWEPDMGVLEAAQRAEMAGIDAQIQDQQAKMLQAAEQYGMDLQDILSSLDIAPIVVPIQWNIPALPTGGGASPPVYPQAAGGDYWVTKPTLFLAGEAGPERATFAPAGRSRESRPADNNTAAQRQIATFFREMSNGVFAAQVASAIVTANAKSGIGRR